MIIDIGAARLAARRPSLRRRRHAEPLRRHPLRHRLRSVSGSVGLSPVRPTSAQDVAMFEASTARRPTSPGQDVANPSGLLCSGAVQMLVHIGQADSRRARLHNAWLRRPRGRRAHRRHLPARGSSTARVGTTGLRRRGHRAAWPGAARAARRCYQDGGAERVRSTPSADENRSPETKTSGRRGRVPRLGRAWAQRGASSATSSTMGAAADRTAVPEDDHQPRREGLPGRPPGDLLHRPLALPLRRAPRTVRPAPTPTSIALLRRAATQKGFDVIKTENLYTFDGERGYSFGQGE